ncbi:hypothetical protein [Nocardia araoensis]|uniref:hypothetical protein n=1 Tax=Nocardia araoensis TaxID=228600 RepID=UPI0012F6B950|nr:hypothetical protein [Nocardia araoensis]
MTTTGLDVRLRVGQSRVEVTRFTKTIDQVVIALREIDALYVRRPPERVTWVVAGLRQHASELSVRVEAESKGRRPLEDLLVPADALVSGARQLQEVAEVPELYSPQTVERVIDIATPKGGLHSVEVATYNGSRGEPVTLSNSVRDNAKEAVRGRGESYGSFAGVLEVLARPRRRTEMLKLSIYDVQTRRAIIGMASSEFEEKVHALFGKRVLAGGLLTRNSSGQAIRLEVKQLEGFEAVPYPKADDLLGAAPDWLGGMSVDAYIAEVRRG